MTEQSPSASFELGELARGDSLCQEVLDALPAAIYMTDAAGRITYFNEAAARLWGRRPALGSSEWWGSLKLFWPDGRPMPLDQCAMARALRENRPIKGMETIAERPDGARAPFISFSTPLYEESGALVGVVNMLVEIAERKRAEEMLREQTRRWEILNQTAQAISSDLELERIFQIVTDSATELSGAKLGAFFDNVVDAQGEHTLRALSIAPQSAFEKPAPPGDMAVLEWIFREAGVIRSNDIRSDPRYGELASHFGAPEGRLPVVSFLFVPVISRSGEVHGDSFLSTTSPASLRPNWKKSSGRSRRRRPLRSTMQAFYKRRGSRWIRAGRPKKQRNSLPPSSSPPRTPF